MKNTHINRISAVVLAAGQSKRMGQNKLLMPFRGCPMLMHTLDLVEELVFGEKILVTSKETAQAVKVSGSFATIINKNPGNGQASSIRLGLEAASLDYYMFFLADMPLLRKTDVLKIISAIDGEKIIVPKAENVPANPVVFPKKFRRELLAIYGDNGGRAVIAAHEADCKTIIFKDPESFKDIDTPEEYQNNLGFQ